MTPEQERILFEAETIVVCALPEAEFQAYMARQLQEYREERRDGAQ